MATRGNIDETLLFFEHGIDLKTNTIYMCSDASPTHSDPEVNGNFASEAIKGLHILESRGKREITMYLSGEGGCYYYGTSLFDFIKTLQNETIAIVMGPCMSAMTIPLQAASHRRMSKHSKLMIHYGDFSLNLHSKAIKNWSAENERACLELEDIYMTRIKQKNKNYKLDDLRKLLNFDTILDATESLKLGLIDEII